MAPVVSPSALTLELTIAKALRVYPLSGPELTVNVIKLAI